MKKQLTKSKYDRKICGVCGGVAEYFEIDPTLVRIIWALISLSMTGLIFYIICAVIMPEPNDGADY